VTADVVRLYGVEPEKVVCVYAGSNVEAPHDFALDNEGYANRRILFVGDDWDRKGGPELLTAFEEVRQTYPDATLTIASAGAPAVSLPGVEVLGRVPLDQLMRHYSQSSVFCLPTRLEPFGIVFLEAMMWRLPIVATSVGAVPDMVEEGLNGHLVIPGDAKALARALIGLIGNPELCRRYGEAGHRRVLDRYTWDQVGRRMREQILPFIRQD
jgi:glycosyltransferase involved in cell wall biosynthesis